MLHILPTMTDCSTNMAINQWKRQKLCLIVVMWIVDTMTTLNCGHDAMAKPYLPEYMEFNYTTAFYLEYLLAQVCKKIMTRKTTVGFRQF